MRIAKFLLGLILVIFLLSLALLGGGYWLAKRSLPQLQGTIQISGLTAPITVYRDANGVPHIYGQSLDDTVFAQGYVTAQDRLWQMDLFRRSALGELSEVLGKETLKLDEKHRTLGFPEAADQAVEAVDEESQHLLGRYADGVNAFINSHRDRLPIEFLLLRYQPQPWTPRDSISIALMMYETLNNTWEHDIFRGKLYEKFGPQMVEDLFPTHSHYEIPLVGIDAPSPKELLNLPNPQAMPSSWPNVAEKIESSGRDQGPSAPWLSLLWTSSPLKSFEGAVRFAKSLSEPDSVPLVGSNNWVVSGAHTTTGKPMLANDPHLAHSIPSIWYQVHLHCPGLNVIGVSLAGAPGIIIGHNEHIAWGMTNLNPDVEDVYLEEFGTGEKPKYLVNGQWKDAVIRPEHIRIRGQADEILNVLVTRHGPVMRREGSTGYALKWTALQPGGLGFPFLNLNRASNWQEFIESLKSFTGPMQNIVYADDRGNIGLYDPGMVPIRRSGIGNIPVPGSTDEYEWIGFIPFADLPHLFNPPAGIIATANQRIAGDSYPYPLGNDWEAPYRFARIYDLLRSKKLLNRDDFLKIQGDIYSEANQVLARIAIQSFERYPVRDPMLVAAVDRLKHGNFIATTDNIETTIIEYLRWQLEETILQGALGDQWKDYHSAMEPVFLENQLTEQPARWLPTEFKNYDELIVRSLLEVCQNLQSLYGSSDPSAWVWGRKYPLLIKHPVAKFWPLTALLNVGPFPQGGTRLTVKATNAVEGPSMRMIVDFSDLDRSYNNITLGASGQLFSPYYKNQLHDWLAVKSYPMLFSDAAVKKAAVSTLMLEPQVGTSANK